MGGGQGTEAAGVPAGPARMSCRGHRLPKCPRAQCALGRWADKDCVGTSCRGRRAGPRTPSSLRLWRPAGRGRPACVAGRQEPAELPSSSSVRSSPLPPPPPSPVLVGRGRDPSQRCPSSSPVPLGKATPSPGSPTRVSGATRVPATARRRLLWSPPLEVEGGPKGPGRGRGQWGVETRAQGTHRLISSSAGSCWAAGWRQAGLSCDSVACWRSGRSSHTRPAWPAPHGTDPTDHAGSGGRHLLSCPVPSAAHPGMRRLLGRRTDAV